MHNEATSSGLPLSNHYYQKQTDSHHSYPQQTPNNPNKLAHVPRASGIIKPS